MKKQDSGYGVQDSGYGIRDTVRDEERASLNPESCLPYPESSIPYPEAERRLRWRCRRGLLELDIIFVRFIEAQYLKLSVEERQTFEELLDLPDNPLWDMVSGRIDAGSDAQAALLLRINNL